MKSNKRKVKGIVFISKTIKEDLLYLNALIYFI